SLCAVSSQLPSLRLEESDLQQNPQFSKLLVEVCQHVDPSGGSASLSRELEEARRELRLQRKVWLRSEVIHRLVQEMLLDLHVRKQEGTLSEEESKFQAVLQRCVSVSDCSCLLTSQGASPFYPMSLLGLEKQNLLELLPPEMDVLWMRGRLQKQLEDALRKKCFTFLSFHQPETDGEGDVLRTGKALRLVSTLEDEKRRLHSEREKQEETAALLGKQQETYPQVVLRCLLLLRQAASELRLLVQSDTDRSNTEYLETKCNALLLKFRMEELQVLTDTYTPEKVEVHRQIRETLERAVRTEEREVSASREILSSYKILGPEFEELVREYTRLRQDIENDRSVLQEISKTVP
ncbi:hypothetical protein FKM82_025292, partial [Ascaphus truei]